MMTAYSVIIVGVFVLTSALLWPNYKRDTLNPFILLKAIVLLAVFYPLLTGQSKVSDDAKFLIAISATLHLVVLDILFILSTRRRKAPVPLVERDKRHRVFWVTMWIFGSSVRAASLATGNLHGTLLATQLEVTSTSNLIGMANGIPAIAMIGYVAFSSKDYSKSLVLLMVGAEIIWNLLSGSKVGFIYGLLPILYVAQRKGIVQITLKRIVIASAVALFSAQFLFVTITAYRLSVQSSVVSNEAININTLVNGAHDSLFSPSIRQNAKAIVNNDEAQLTRTDYTSFFGLLYDRPDLWRAIDRPNTIAPVFVWWIPRALWADKPINDVGSWFGQHVFDWSRTTRSQAAITIWGDGLLNLGPAGVVFFPMVLFGFVFLFLEYCNRRGSWGLILLAATYVKLALSLEATLALSLIAIQAQAILVLLFYLLSRLLAPSQTPMKV